MMSKLFPKSIRHIAKCKGSQYTEEDNFEANSSFALKLFFFRYVNVYATCSLANSFAFAI